MTHRAIVEVFDPASTQVRFEVITAVNINRAVLWE
jgi:hypothetical protein